MALDQDGDDANSVDSEAPPEEDAEADMLSDLASTVGSAFEDEELEGLILDIPELDIGEICTGEDQSVNVDALSTYEDSRNEEEEFQALEEEKLAMEMQSARAESGQDEEDIPWESTDEETKEPAAKRRQIFHPSSPREEQQQAQKQGRAENEEQEEEKKEEEEKEEHEEEKDKEQAKERKNEEEGQIMRLPAGIKRPAARGTRAAELCAGHAGRRCEFCTQSPGAPAKLRKPVSKNRCLFCDSVAMREASKRKGYNPLTAGLKTFLARSPAVFDAALARIRLLLGEAAAADFERRARGQRRQPRRRQASQTTWEEQLRHRKHRGAQLSQERRRIYEKEVQSDQRIARRKIFYPERINNRHKVTLETEAEEREHAAKTGAIGQLAANDTELPEPTDPIQKMVELWCKEGSWGICDTCHSVCHRNLEPQDTRSVRSPTIPSSQCKACKSGAYIPQPSDIPKELRNLSDKAKQALRPLDIDTGKFQRSDYGYRVHTAMISFAWAADGVDAKIAALARRKDRRKAEAALAFLLAQPKAANHYKKFYKQHKAFLRKYGTGASEQKRKQPLRFIEEEGLECCLWPHLYWRADLCETVVRNAHETRKRKRAKRDSNDSENESSEPEEQEAAQRFGRIRMHFMRKVFSPVVGYGADYELLHYIYDLSMWTTIGTKKNIASQYNVQLRLVLKGCPWAPQYWRIQHQGVVDLQRQCGNAALFRTRAPYERTFPYHRWVMDEQTKLGKRRTHLSGPETLHMAHVLTQLDKGFICGDKFSTEKQSKTWQNHVLGCNDGTSQPTVQARVTRLEFQDGKRKLATQSYHGRGTTHSHSLDFLQNIGSIGLEKKISASIPSVETDAFMHGLVMDSQCDRKDSKRPIRNEPSAWDPATGKLLLHHSEEDKLENVRAYFRSTMPITKCHEDIQQGDGNGAVLRYVSTYSTKFSSALARRRDSLIG